MRILALEKVFYKLRFFYFFIFFFLLYSENFLFVKHKIFFYGLGGMVGEVESLMPLSTSLHLLKVLKETTTDDSMNKQFLLNYFSCFYRFI